MSVFVVIGEDYYTTKMRIFLDKVEAQYFLVNIKFDEPHLGWNLYEVDPQDKEMMEWYR